MQLPPTLTAQREYHNSLLPFQASQPSPSPSLPSLDAVPHLPTPQHPEAFILPTICLPLPAYPLPASPLPIPPSPSLTHPNPKILKAILG